MKVVPQVFYRNPKIEKVLIDGLSCVILKSVETADLQNDRYLAAHAITLVLNGSLQVETPDGDLSIVHKNQLILLPKGLYMISDIIPKENNFQAIVFFFDEQITNEFLSNFKKKSKQVSSDNLIINYNQDLRLFVDSLLTLYNGKKQYQFTRPKLLEFLHLLHLSEKGNEFVDKLMSIKNRERKNITSFMQEYYDKPLDVEDYAYLTGRSISTFRRDFKSKFGISPKKWIIEKRLDKAADLLKIKNESVTNIALQSGYDNTSHFIKAFQKKYNTSPKQYQIQHRKEFLL